jgi:hypothetical protein
VSGLIGGWAGGIWVPVRVCFEVWPAADFEDLVGFVDEELVFVIGKLAVNVELFKFGGDDSGASIAVFFDIGGFAAGPGK